MSTCDKYYVPESFDVYPVIGIMWPESFDVYPVIGIV